jgi:hypothetical protein
MGKGLRIITDDPGTGPAAAPGCVVVYSARIFLPRGEEVTRDRAILAEHPGHPDLPTRCIDGARLIEHQLLLGRRRAIAAIEHGLVGMQPGGVREFIAPPQLGYGARGVPNLIPKNTALRIRLWLHDVRKD